MTALRTQRIVSPASLDSARGEPAEAIHSWKGRCSALKYRIATSAMSDTRGDGTGHPTSEKVRLDERRADGGCAVPVKRPHHRAVAKGA